MPSGSPLYSAYSLPHRSEAFLADWNAVIMPPGTKSRLLAYVRALQRLQPVEPTSLGIRRAVLLFGPPGCGKTSLARGLPAAWVASTGQFKAAFIHVHTHALFSGVRGEGQKNVLSVFRAIGEMATSQENGRPLPLFVLIDEVETLGTDRTSINLEANPLDAMYQVTAFLESLDLCARESPNVTFVFTTNLPRGIDRAVRERVDFEVEIPLPSEHARAAILADGIGSLAAAFDVSDLLATASAKPVDPQWRKVVEATQGLSGRTLRHLLILAATAGVDSPVLTMTHLEQALHEKDAVEASLLASRGIYNEVFQEESSS